MRKMTVKRTTTMIAIVVFCSVIVYGCEIPAVYCTGFKSRVNWYRREDISNEEVLSLERPG